MQIELPVKVYQFINRATYCSWGTPFCFWQIIKSILKAPAKITFCYQPFQKFKIRWHCCSLRTPTCTFFMLALSILLRKKLAISLCIQYKDSSIVVFVVVVVVVVVMFVFDITTWLPQKAVNIPQELNASKEK